MKLMKKAMKCLVAVFMMAMAFVATGVTAEAAEMVARTFDNNLEDVSVIKAKDLSCFGEPGVFDGEAVDGLMQTEATSTSVTISWNPAYGAIGYYVGEVGQDGYVIESSLISVDTTYVTWPVSEYGAVLAVIPIDVDYEASTSFGAALEVYPLPKKVTGLKVDGGFGNGGKLNVVWNSNVCCGFEAVCYNKKGKVVQTVDEWTYRDATFSKTNSQNIYSVKVRAYNWINGKSKKVYRPSVCKGFLHWINLRVPSGLRRYCAASDRT